MIELYKINCSVQGFDWSGPKVRTIETLRTASAGTRVYAWEQGPRVHVHGEAAPVDPTTARRPPPRTPSIDPEQLDALGCRWWRHHDDGEPPRSHGNGILLNTIHQGLKYVPYIFPPIAELRNPPNIRDLWVILNKSYNVYCILINRLATCRVYTQ